MRNIVDSRGLPVSPFERQLTEAENRMTEAMGWALYGEESRDRISELRRSILGDQTGEDVRNARRVEGLLASLPDAPGPPDGDEV